MTPQSRAIWLIRAENPQTRGLAGGAGRIRTPGAANAYIGGIRPTLGVLFGPNEIIPAGENMFPLDRGMTQRRGSSCLSAWQLKESAK